MADRPTPNWTESFRKPTMIEDDGPRDPDHGIVQLTSPVSSALDSDGPKGIYRPGGGFFRSTV